MTTRRAIGAAEDMPKFPLSPADAVELPSDYQRCRAASRGLAAAPFLERRRIALARRPVLAALLMACRWAIRPASWRRAGEASHRILPADFSS